MGAKEARLSPTQATRARILDCCGGQLIGVREYSAASCHLWPYRFGRKPEKEEKGKGVQHGEKKEVPYRAVANSHT